MAGYTIQMYNSDWFISLINIMMWCVFSVGKADKRNWVVPVSYSPGGSVRRCVMFVVTHLSQC